MARTAKADGESVQGYFRPIFKENPKLLKERSNEPLYQRWLKDHPGETTVPDRVKQGLSNLKSVLRNKRTIRKAIRESVPAESTSSSNSGNSSSSSNNGTAAVRSASPGRKPDGLVTLEAQIDEALASARKLDPEALSEVIRMLRAARNRVILEIG